MLNIKQTLCMILLGCLFVNVDARKENSTENNQTNNSVAASQICNDEKDESSIEDNQTDNSVAASQICSDEKNENAAKDNKTDNSVTVSKVCNNEKNENKIKIEKIEVDCMISVGEACRPCQHLRKNSLRISAFPLDWMMSYSLETAIHFFETQFADFFENIEEIPNKYCGNHKFVKDVKNGVISIHHFRKDEPLESEHKKFRTMMLGRAKKLHNILKNSHSIGLICNRKDASGRELINFIEKFSKIYPNKKITLINVVDEDIPEFKKSVLFENENLKIIQFTFKDAPAVKDEKKFPQWEGNPDCWKKIMENIKVNEENLKNKSEVELY